MIRLTLAGGDPAMPGEAALASQRLIADILGKAA